MSYNNTKGLKENRPSLFQPAIIRSLANEAAKSVTLTLSDAELNDETTIGETGSFRYDLAGTGLKSTQQLNIDWSNFENHTFFNSAQVKVNVAYDRIQNGYPFDGTKKEVETFIDSLTGYEKYVYDNYPKNKGYLFFSGTRGEGFGGTYVTVKDIAGAAFPSLSRKIDGTTVLNPEDNSLTLEYWLFVPTTTNDNQAIVDKHSGSMGFLASLNSTGSSTSGSSTFWLVSGSVTTGVTVAFPKGEWNHFAWVWDRTPGQYKVSSYLNGAYYNSSSMPVEYGDFSATSDMYIGSGSALLSSWTPANTLSGALDELRIWHSVREVSEIKENMEKMIFASDDLKLCYRFNEPSGSNSNLVIDCSSNSLHGKLSSAGVSFGVREFASASVAGESPMTYEALSYCPILFPSEETVVDFRTELMLSASIYDVSNPNIITKLIPKHYLLEGQVEDALTSEEGQILTDLTISTDPRTTKLGSTQVLLLLLYSWAKFFDELKLYTQAFADLGFVDYDVEDTIPDQFLQKLARSQGIELPPMFVGSALTQFLDANNLQDNISKNTFTLQYIQNQIWRRILVNLRDVVTSKGTIHGVKSFIRATGVDPDNNFRIREYGGPTKRSLTYARDNRSEISTMLNFLSGGFVSSSYLSASRVEPGYPLLGGAAPAMNHYLTSGSFTFEGIYRWAPGSLDSISQSLIRFHTTGSTVGKGLILNLVAVSASTPTLNLYCRPSTAPNSPYFNLELTGANIFDGEKWHISIGRIRNDEEILSSSISSSYFLRATKPNYGSIIESFSTASFFNEFSGTLSLPIWQIVSSSLNASGSYFAIGSQSIDTSSNHFLNDSTAVADGQARTTNFSGRVSQMRFWSKFLTLSESREHARDFRSKGVEDPLTNFSFITNKSGSWQRLRLDASTDQTTTASNASGLINIFDFSQNNFHLSGGNFLATSSVVVPERYYYTYISPKFDEASTIEKVRIRSFSEYSNVLETPWAEVAPVYEIPRSEQPIDTTKFTIDYSVVDAMNQDIVNIFATLDSLDNVLGNPELMFSADYPGLENLRSIYFNRLTGKVNLKSFFEFYKWFDTNIGSFVSQLIPRKTKFVGTNFVVESHMLERSKLEYYFQDIYLGDSNRNGLKDTILLQLFVGEFSRY